MARFSDSIESKQSGEKRRLSVLLLVMAVTLFAVFSTTVRSPSVLDATQFMESTPLLRNPQGAPEGNNNNNNKVKKKKSKYDEGYDPTKCTNMKDGHCADREGGAWSYRKNNGECAHTEASAPRDWIVAPKMQALFPDVKNGVLDFGGGLGPYLLSFREEQIPNLTVMEPHSLEGCLFRGLGQSKTDLVNMPLKDVPVQKYDLVMTTEVLEHIPVEHHEHLVDALTQMTRKWLLFAAAHPGQPGEGHVGPSMKTRVQWQQEILSHGILEVDEAKTKEFIQSCGPLSPFRRNAVVFRRKS